MQFRKLFVPVLIGLLAVHAVPALADDAASSGVKAEMLNIIGDAETKLNDLAGRPQYVVDGKKPLPELV